MKYITKKGLAFLNERSKRQKEAGEDLEDDEAARERRSKKNRGVDDRIEAGRIKLFSKDPS